MKSKRIVALTLLTCLLMGCQQADETAKNDQSTVELIQLMIAGELLCLRQMSAIQA